MSQTTQAKITEQVADPSERSQATASEDVVEHRSRVTTDVPSSERIAGIMARRVASAFAADKRRLARGEK